MPRLSGMAAALLSALFSFTAQATTPLPDAPAVHAAWHRALETDISRFITDEKPESPFASPSMFLGRLRLVEVVGVHGCVPLQAGQLHCLISFDEGFGQIRYSHIQLEKRNGQWEALPRDQDAPEPAPPAPTPAQAQAAVQAYAREQLARGANDQALKQIDDGTGFLAPSLSDCRLNEQPFVTCNVDSSWSAASEGTEIRSGSMSFRLQGDQWHYEE